VDSNLGWKGAQSYVRGGAPSGLTYCKTTGAL